MMRRLAIGLAAAVIATGGATLSASAHHGGGAQHGGSYRGGVTHYGGSAKGMYKPGRAYGEYGYGKSRPDYWRHRHGWRHGYYRTYGTYGGGSCWRWTPEGGRMWVCGYERPYGYSGYHREYYRHRYGHYGPRYGAGHRGPFYGRK